MLTGTARQPLFSVILSPSIYLSIYLCLSADFSAVKGGSGRATGCRLSYGVYKTAGVRNIFPSALCECH